MSRFQDIKKELSKAANKEKATFLSGYFKTGKGEYGEGDIFLGITVPEQRKIAYTFIDLKLSDIEKLLESNIHEYRFTALEILVAEYERGSPKQREEIYNFYLAHTQRINNWDLVDTSARDIVGNFLFTKSRKILHKLVKSSNLWERRIAIIATHYFINKGDLQETFALAKILLKDKEDLIHKAVGWTLREAGKKDIKALRKFLGDSHKEMARTCLRYAIEKFEEKERKKYLKGLV